MMSPLLTEADIVSQELLDILLINIVEPHKVDFLFRLKMLVNMSSGVA